MNPYEVRLLLENLTDEEKFDFLKEILNNSDTAAKQLLKIFENKSINYDSHFKDFENSVRHYVEKYRQYFLFIEMGEFDRIEWGSFKEIIFDNDTELDEFEATTDDLIALIQSNHIGMIENGDLIGFFASLTGWLIIFREIAEPKNEDYESEYANLQEISDVTEIYDELEDDESFDFYQVNETIEQVKISDDFFNDAFIKLEKFEKVLALKSFQPFHVDLVLRLIVRYFTKVMAREFDASVQDQLLLTIIKGLKDKANIFYSTIKICDKSLTVLPKTNYFILKRDAPDSSEWISLAEKLSQVDLHIAKDYLKYLLSNDKTSFYRFARKSYYVFNEKIKDFLVAQVDDYFDMRFLKWLLEKTKEIIIYRQLKRILNKQEIEIYREKFNTRWNLHFYIKILEEDGLFFRILDLATSWKEGLYRLDIIIKPILNVFPDECWTIIVGNITEELTVRKYSFIESMVTQILLIYADTTKRYSSVIVFANELVESHKNNNTLINEFKNAELI
jgi:hypothetical protein